MKRTADYLNDIARNSDFFYQLKPEESKKLRDVLMEMYQDIWHVCKKYNLSLMLGGGSCLGAVRHGGFIPWDDDFDMMMSREDFDKFIKVFDEELTEKYELSVPRQKLESKTLFMQVIKKGTVLLCADDLSRDDANGIRVDLYAIERVPDNSALRYLKLKFLNLLRIFAISTNIYETNNKLFKQALSQNRIYYAIRYFIGFVFSFVGRKKLYDYFDRIASNSKGTKFRTIPTGRKMSDGECQPVSVFFPPKEAKFEGYDALIPNREDLYLKRLYGNYMEIPPVEKRERHFYVKLDFGD